MLAPGWSANQWRRASGRFASQPGGGAHAWRRGPFSYIDMGGMFTVLKVREQPRAEDAFSWYTHPSGTVATRAGVARMQADGIADALARLG